MNFMCVCVCVCGVFFFFTIAQSPMASQNLIICYPYDKWKFLHIVLCTKMQMFVSVWTIMFYLLFSTGFLLVSANNQTHIGYNGKHFPSSFSAM